MRGGINDDALIVCGWRAVVPRAISMPVVSGGAGLAERGGCGDKCQLHDRSPQFSVSGSEFPLFGRFGLNRSCLGGMPYFLFLVFETLA